jgi:hypothetical protein
MNTRTSQQSEVGGRAKYAVVHANPFELINTLGFVHQPDAAVRYFLERVCRGDIGEAEFRRSWDRLVTDAYMKDGGTYRKRRFSTLETRGPEGRLVQTEPRPHFQKQVFNGFAGDIERWYPDLEDAVLSSPVMQAILESFVAVCNFCSANRRWRIEVHQFRITAEPAQLGKPTPEGIHRDGVDFGLIMLINRVNVSGGHTVIQTPDGRQLAEMTLMRPFETILLDDVAVRHGVSEIAPVDPTKPAYRDTLVVTARALP